MTRRAGAAILAALALLLAAGFAALGVWQVERRAWKLDLIQRVEARIHAPASLLPHARDWPSLAPRDYEYRHVRATGNFLHDRDTLVQALTERGAGFWVVTPLRTADGVVLVNRGFVTADRRAPASRAEAQIAGNVTVTGLMRVSEPKGGFLRANDPGGGRWYSRDVQAIARARDLESAAPFFIDADATPNPGGLPIGGLTVVSFRNTHLIYAITWFALAALSLFAAARLLRQDKAR